MYNPALGKFLSVDPLAKSYPWYTPYQFAGNKPIQAIDLDGLEEYFVQTIYADTGEPHTRLVKTVTENGVLQNMEIVDTRIDKDYRDYKVLHVKQFADGREIIEPSNSFRYSNIVKDVHMTEEKDVSNVRQQFPRELPEGSRYLRTKTFGEPTSTQIYKFRYALASELNPIEKGKPQPIQMSGIATAWHGSTDGETMSSHSEFNVAGGRVSIDLPALQRVANDFATRLDGVDFKKISLSHVSNVIDDAGIRNRNIAGDIVKLNQFRQALINAGIPAEKIVSPSMDDIRYDQQPFSPNSGTFATVE